MEEEEKEEEKAIVRSAPDGSDKHDIENDGQVSKEQLYNSFSCRALENSPGSHVSTS